MIEREVNLKIFQVICLAIQSYPSINKPNIMIITTCRTSNIAICRTVKFTGAHLIPHHREKSTHPYSIQSYVRPSSLVHRQFVASFIQSTRARIITRCSISARSHIAPSSKLLVISHRRYIRKGYIAIFRRSTTVNCSRLRIRCRHVRHSICRIVVICHVKDDRICHSS